MCLIRYFIKYSHLHYVKCFKTFNHSKIINNNFYRPIIITLRRGSTLCAVWRWWWCTRRCCTSRWWTSAGWRATGRVPTRSRTTWWTILPLCQGLIALQEQYIFFYELNFIEKKKLLILSRSIYVNMLNFNDYIQSFIKIYVMVKQKYF